MPKRKSLRMWQAVLVSITFAAIPLVASRFTFGPHILLGGFLTYVLVSMSIYRWRNRKEPR